MNHRIFRFCSPLLLLIISISARADVTPPDAELKEDAITRITCAYDGKPVTPSPGVTFTPAAGEYHYDLYLPPGYHNDTKAVFPLLFVASPGGKARLGAMAERVKQDRFIAVMLVESKNGPWEPGIANFCSAHDDVVQRTRVAEGFKYMTGMSGGARSTSMYTALRPGFVGMFLQAAGFWQTEQGPYAMTAVLQNPRLAVYATFGTRDMNLDEAGLLAQYLPHHTAYHSQIFPGGHQWAPRQLVDDAFDWLEEWTYFSLPADMTAAARTMYGTYFAKLTQRCDQAKTPFEKYEWMEKAKNFASSHDFDMTPGQKEAVAGYSKQLVALADDDSMKKEIAARDAYVKADAMEEALRRRAGRNIEKGKAATAEALKEYETISKRHVGTVYAARIQRAIERLNVEAAPLPRAGN